MDWQPIGTAPTHDRTSVDLWVPEIDGVPEHRVPDCWWDDGWMHFAMHQGYQPVENPSHWMLVPEPPTLSKEDHT